MNTQPAPSAPPDLSTLLAAARDLAPVFRERAAETEALRRLPDQNVADLKAAGLFRVIQPERCDGWQMDFHAHLDVVEEVAAGCGSTGWCLGVLQIHSWLVGLLGEQAQEDIYRDDPDALIAAVLNPRGTARQTDNGYTLQGFWPFGSGSEHSSWLVLGAQVLDADDEVVDEGCFAVPASDIEIRDDWHVVGLRGTGSCSMVAKGVAVPTYRYISFVEGRRGVTPGADLHDGTLFRAPLSPALAIALCGPAVGIAEGAIRDFAAYVQERRNPQLRGASQIDSPITHQVVAEAKGRVDAARVLLHRAADDIHQAAEQGGDMPQEVRARIRMDSAYAVRLCMEAGEEVFLACGGSGLSEKNPIQRAWRDLHAINQHALLQLSTNAEIYGRTLLGLEPGTDIL